MPTLIFVLSCLIIKNDKMLLLFIIMVAESLPVWDRASIRFTVRVFCYISSICVCASFPFDFEGERWELIVFLLIIAYMFLYLCKHCVFQNLFDNTDVQEERMNIQ